MSSLFGLMTTEQFKSEYSLSARRRVFYQYPNGAAPLTGLLSLMDTEEVDKAEDFGWVEQRNITHEYLTAQANSAGPFTDTSGSAGAVGTDLTAAGWSGSAGDTIRVKLANLTGIQVRDVLLFRNVPGTSSSLKNFQGTITAVWTAHNTIDVRLNAAAANNLNGTTANGISVIMIGSATPEGDRSKSGFVQYPITITNNTQIFRHAFEFSRSALKAGAKWDKTGVYKHKAKQNSLKHMKALEYAVFFSDKAVNNSVVTDDNLDSTIRYMGGVLWYLKQWEKGNTVNGGAFNYRLGGSDVTSSAWATTDEKRIIDVNGTMTVDQFHTLIERPFRFISDSSYELLALCGSGFLKAFQDMCKRESIAITKLSTSEAYGMQVTAWETIYGTIYFKTHPLFNQTGVFNNSAFFLDIGNLKYRPLNDSDTELLKNRQNRDFDGRKDEWLTECGLEVHFPESMMFIDRCTGIVS